MEAAASVAAARSVPLPMQSSHPSRKEWRVVSEQSARNASNEDMERSKLGQSDERTIYEQGREPVDVDFCSITIDGSSDNDILQQRLHSVGRRKEELQQIEIELRAQIIARSEIMELQNNYDKQIKEHANANVKLQERLHEMEQTIHELERKMEEKDRELHAIKLDNEAAWAKEDLLREQSKELQSFRRERDNTEAERAQHVKQIHDFQEHFQEKERQLLELQEQHRVAQENILFKDEQLRDAQAWITRVQEMDAVQATTNHSLQAELRERTEQYNQLWLGCQRQFAEMERLHLHTVQQLQLELADARRKSGTYPDESHASQTISKDASQIGQNNGNQLDVNGSSIPVANSGSLPNGGPENVSSFVSAGNASAQADHPHGVPIAPSSLLGMPTYLPAGQVTGLHPYVMHQQGVPHSITSQVAQSHVGHFHSVPAPSPLQHWQNQQASLEGSQVPTQNHYPPSQTDQTLLRSDTNYDYEVSLNGQSIRSEYLDIHVSQGVETEAVIPPAADGGQVFEQVDESYLVAPQSQQSLQHISSQFHDALRLDPLSQNSETKEKATATLSNHVLEGQGFPTEQASSGNAPSSETQINHMNSSETNMNNATGAVSSEAFVSSRQKNLHMGGKTLELPLLDERSLLACIVRTIPPGSGGRIRISSTLPNRLAKMLAPLHWHDYKKKYGKLDDFVAGHPELFVIEGDDIQVRDGAQEIIAATAALAKVAAAAKTASSPYSSLLPSVAVTPVAQSNRLKRAPSMDSNSVKSDKTISKEYVAPTPASAADNPSQLSVPNQHSNGVYLNAGVGNGANLERSGSSLSKRSTHVRPSANVVGKQQGRTTALASNSRR
ncbi:Unconventional myosin-XVIIIa like [Actinidia chinensis var. chinensis]|uniref:Unconventional myosin-XVIIIa like n=1 Tax=Actinidia chinensis var. chinensis TaxID=1590841 RepID=A0A2R6Q9B2_ACTCC|nr:Unconventional myosin-XVIIIa like [Actinidia chinensis var. chinensis]